MAQKILIVEDDVFSARLLERILRNFGYLIVGIVANAEEAILAVQNSNPDIVFMDIDLEGPMNGITVAGILTGYYKTNVIFVSIHSDSTTRKLAMRYSHAFLEKPYSTENIAEAIQSLEARLDHRPTENEDLHERFQIKNKDQYFFIDLYDIVVIEALDHMVTIKTKDNDYKTRGRLKDFLAADTKQKFLCPHRSYLVNVDAVGAMIFVDKQTYYLKLKFRNIQVPVSRNRIAEIKKRLLLVSNETRT